MMMTAVVFFALAFMAFLGALTLVFHKHPVVATLGMAVATLSVGALYIVLHVPFLGLFQVIVYAGAVMVIVLYIIMSLGHEETGAQVVKTPDNLGLGGIFETSGQFNAFAHRKVSQPGQGQQHNKQNRGRGEPRRR